MRVRPLLTLSIAALPLLVALLWVATAAAATLDGPPVTPHPLEGRGDCLICHKAGSPQGVPADHTGRPNTSCVACHPAGGPAAALPTATKAAPTATAAATAPAPAVPTAASAVPTTAPTLPTAASTARADTPAAPVAPATAPAVPSATSGPADASSSQPATTASTSAPSQAAGKNDLCLACHQDRASQLSFPNGDKITLAVDTAEFNGSVHGQQGVACVDCHTGINGYPHPKASDSPVSYRDYALAADNLCQKCHSENYSKAQDSVHGHLITDGNQQAPSCTDCHGAHDVAPPDEPRQRISQTCATCHDQVYQEYASSVHGSALLHESNVDVPICTDCHGVHDISDPRTAAFRVQSPDLCAKCHGDETKMAKYGLSSKVTATYEREFHGVTTTLYKTNYPTVWCYKAVCTDCHGVHNIVQSTLPASSVYKDNLPETCSKCHPGATANFAGAWIGHYEPSPDNSPLVYYVNLFYQLFIPLLMFGLLAFIGLEVFHRLRLWLRPSGRR